MSARAWLVSAMGFALLTRLMAGPLVDFDNLADAIHPGDARLLAWTLAWDAHALLSGLPLFDANMFHPQAGALGWAEHHVGLGLFAVPVFALTGNAVYTYWCLWLSAFVLNGLAMQALAFRVTKDAAAAFAAGLVYAFAFFRMQRAHGHIQMLWTWALPLMLLAAHGWVARPSTSRTVIVTGLVVLQALSGWYLAVDVALLLLVAAPCLLPGRTVTARHAWLALGAALVVVPTLLWFAGAYTHLPGNTLAEVQGNSADVASYLTPPANTWPGRWLGSRGLLQPRLIWGEQTLYLGAVGLGLAIAGIGRWFRAPDRLTAAAAPSGGVGLLLSFGPGASGHRPFDWFTMLPAMGLLRAPGRFALLVVFGQALLVAGGVVWLRQSWRRAAPAALAVLLVAGLAESYVVDFPGGGPPREPIPAVYRRIASLPPGPVLSLPTYRFAPDNFREADYLLFSTAHWQPVVNGFGRHEPPGHKARMATLARCPAADAGQQRREMRVRYVVLHPDRASELARAADAATAVPGVHLVARDGPDLLFELDAS